MVSRILGGIDQGIFAPRDEGLGLPEYRRPELWNTPSVDAVLRRAAQLVPEPDVCLPYSAFLRFFHDGNRQEYEDWYFARRRRLGVLALAALSGRGSAFLAPLQNLLWAICEESTWALPAHLDHPGALVTVDLFAAETASALAEIASLLGDRLEPSLRSRIEAEVEARFFTPYGADRAPWAWESAAHNWSAVCGGGVGIAALWLLDDERLVGLLRRLGPAFDAYLSGFTDEGLCLEGMGYWTYGFGYFVAFAELLRERSRGRVDLLADPELAPRLRAIAAFPAVGRLGDRDFARFSDAPEEFRYPRGLCARLVRRLGAPEGLDPALAEDLASDHYCRWVRELREVLWVEAEAPGSSPRAERAWYPQAQWLVVRGSKNGTSIGLAAKGGHNAEPHNHNDVGTFQLVIGDEVFIDDLGAGRYERDYFREGRYGYFVNSSRSHAVPLIDGREQVAGLERRATDASCSLHELALTMDAAYDAPGLASFRRRLSWTPETVLPLTLTDQFHFDGPGHEVVERFVTRLPVTLEGPSVVIAGSRHRLRLRSDAPARVSVTPVVYPPHEGPERTAFCIDFAYPLESGDLVLRLDLMGSP